MERREIRVAAYTTQQRDIRVIGIVLTHLKSSSYRYSLVPPHTSADIDVALVDANDPTMLLLLTQALQTRPNLLVIHLVRELGQAGQRVELASYQLMMQLLPTLETLLKQAETKAVVAQHGRQAPDKALDKARPVTPKKLRALIVDDSQTVRTQLANVMSRIGMACDIADGAKAALSRLSAQQYDLIYVDVMMPDMDGYTLTREIKRDRANKAPVIILTSQSSPFDRARGALAGCDIFLTKPVGMKQFYAATTKALRKSLAVDDLSEWIRDPSVPAPPAHA
jgi:twitching motility two-component system response regulator PilG